MDIGEHLKIEIKKLILEIYDKTQPSNTQYSEKLSESLGVDVCLQEHRNLKQRKIYIRSLKECPSFWSVKKSFVQIGQDKKWQANKIR